MDNRCLRSRQACACACHGGYAKHVDTHPSPHAGGRLLPLKDGYTVEGGWAVCQVGWCKPGNHVRLMCGIVLCQRSTACFLTGVEGMRKNRRGEQNRNTDLEWPEMPPTTTELPAEKRNGRTVKGKFTAHACAVKKATLNKLAGLKNPAIIK